MGGGVTRKFKSGGLHERPLSFVPRLTHIAACPTKFNFSYKHIRILTICRAPTGKFNNFLNQVRPDVTEITLLES